MISSDFPLTDISLSVSPDSKLLAALGPNPARVVIFDAESMSPVKKLRREPADSAAKYLTRLGDSRRADDHPEGGSPPADANKAVAAPAFAHTFFAPDASAIYASTESKLVRFALSSGGGSSTASPEFEESVGPDQSSWHLPRRAPSHLVMCPDGRVIVGCAANPKCQVNSLHAWAHGGAGANVRVRAQEYPGHYGTVTGISFSPPGDRLVSVDSTGAVFIWRCDPGPSSDDADLDAAPLHAAEEAEPRSLYSPQPKEWSPVAEGQVAEVDAAMAERAEALSSPPTASVETMSEVLLGRGPDQCDFASLRRADDRHRAAGRLESTAQRFRARRLGGGRGARRGGPGDAAAAAEATAAAAEGRSTLWWDEATKTVAFARDASLLLVDMDTSQRVALTGHDSEIRCLAGLPGLAYVATGSAAVSSAGASPSLSLWRLDASGGQVHTKLHHHDITGVQALAALCPLPPPDERAGANEAHNTPEHVLLSVGCWDPVLRTSTVICWDCLTGSVVAAQQVPQAVLDAAPLPPNGARERSFVTAGAETAALWTLRGSNLSRVEIRLAPYVDRSLTVACAAGVAGGGAHHPIGQLAALVDHEGRVWLWDAAVRKTVASFAPFPDPRCLKVRGVVVRGNRVFAYAAGLLRAFVVNEDDGDVTPWHKLEMDAGTDIKGLTLCAGGRKGVLATTAGVFFLTCGAEGGRAGMTAVPLHYLDVEPL